jgi:hypothetical protein
MVLKAAKAGAQLFGRQARTSRSGRHERPRGSAGKQLGCPVILGSSGMVGGNRNLDWMIDIAKEVFAELGCNAGELTQSSIWDAVSASRAFMCSQLSSTIRIDLLRLHLSPGKAKS